MVKMINEAFTKKREELEAKYHDRIAGISRACDVDMGFAWDRFVANAERGTAYPGGGDCTVDEWSEIVADVATLRALGRG